MASGSDADILVAGGEARCVGSWTVHRIEGVERRLPRLEWPEGAEVALDCSLVEALDTAGASLLQAAAAEAGRAGRAIRLQGLRPEHQALLQMVRAPGKGAVVVQARPGPLDRVGERAFEAAGQLRGILSLVGESAVAGLRALRRPSRLRWRPVLHNLKAAGFDALPIVGLLSFLMGLVIAYQGAAQLKRYGANIFVADLVGLAMLRELSPLLTAIIVAGRSGSAYAAQIGTMKVTEEIDALRTIGIAPVELLVLPKIIALTIALPLLTVYADALGVAGGMMMGKLELAVGYEDFLDRFEHAILLSDYLVGIGKAPVFAAIIAVAGCHQGFQVDGSAESVGRRTTMSVVQSIFLVIIADALFSVAFSSLGI